MLPLNSERSRKNPCDLLPATEVRHMRTHCLLEEVPTHSSKQRFLLEAVGLHHSSRLCLLQAAAAHQARQWCLLLAVEARRQRMFCLLQAEAVGAHQARPWFRSHRAQRCPTKQLYPVHPAASQLRSPCGLERTLQPLRLLSQAPQPLARR